MSATSPLSRPFSNPDPQRVVDQVIEGTNALHCLVSTWDQDTIRETHIIGAERSLVGIQTLLSRLRAHVHPSGGVA